MPTSKNLEISELARKITVGDNNITLTGIGIGVEIGDVIKISGAEDAKNNSEFTIEVITDNNNIIVNQAHANKGTAKNVANRSGDTGVTVKLLAKWYNAPIGLGQSWVSFTVNRAINVLYTNTTGKTLVVNIWFNSENSVGDSIYGIEVDGIDVAHSNCKSSPAYPRAFISANVPNGATYRFKYIYGTNLVYMAWSEIR